MQKLTSVLFLERPLAQYCDGELKGEHTDVASSLAATKVEQKHLKVIIKELAARRRGAVCGGGTLAKERTEEGRKQKRKKKNPAP